MVVGVAACKDSGCSNVIVDHGQGNRDAGLFGVLGFYKAFGIGVDLEEMDGVVKPVDEVLGFVGEIVYKRLILDQHEGRRELQVIVMVDNGGSCEAAFRVGFVAGNGCCDIGFGHFCRQCCAG